MSLIEQAARRLEELKRAGVEIPVEAVDRRFGQAPAGASAPGAASGRSAPAPASAPVPREQVVLDLAALAQAGFLVPGHSLPQLTGEMRVIKRPLLDNVRGKSAAPIARAGMILVTSAQAGEGKTFTAINLALSLATELDTQVLLVEADPGRPAAMQRLGVAEGSGLLDLLAAPGQGLAACQLDTNVPKLSLMRVGRRTDRDAELLSSQAMHDLLDQLAREQPDCVVVFDAPPLLVTPEARSLALLMGQVVLVVEAGQTPQADIVQAAEMLEKCPVVMSVLNKAHVSAAGANQFTYYA